MKASYEPLRDEPWALDTDSTVKPLYGHQQDATRRMFITGSFIASLRIVPDVEV